MARLAHTRAKGQAIVLISMLLPVLLGMAGFAVDAGNLYVNRTNAQRTADAAALAGAQTVLTSSSQGTTDARTYATYNGDPSATVVVSTTIRAHDTIQVTSQKPVTTYFLALLGHTSDTISATAKAQVGMASSLTPFSGAIPWAINDGQLLGYGYNTVAVLHPSNSIVPGMNFQAITPPNGQTYANAIANGISSPMAISTNYATRSDDYSSISTATYNALQARISAAPTETYLTFGQNSPRVIVFGVFAGSQPNAPAPVQFTTFHAFFIESVTEGPSGKVTGRFVKLNVPSGTMGGPTVPDQGVYVIKMIE